MFIFLNLILFLDMRPRSSNWQRLDDEMVRHRVAHAVEIDAGYELNQGSSACWLIAV